MKISFSSFILLFSFVILTNENASAQTEVWSTMGNGLGQSGGRALEIYNGELYAGGSFLNAGNNIARWDGSGWHPVGLGVNGSVYAMAVYNNELYVAGSFTLAGGHSTHNIAKWNGTSWDTVGHGVSGTGCAVLALCVYNGELYAGGRFSTAGYTSASNFAKWDGTSWSAVGTGISGISHIPEIDALEEYNGELYIGGYFEYAGTAYIPNLARYDGSSFSALSAPLNAGTTDGVACLENVAGSLYAGGSFSSSTDNSSLHNIGRWDGSHWYSLGSGTNMWVSALTAYGNDLYLGGEFTMADSIPVLHVAMWDGNTYSPLGTGIDTNVYALAADNGILYATGYFTQAGGNPAYNIAKWSDPGVGINEFSANENVLLFPNPSDGKFSVAVNNLPGEKQLEIYDAYGNKVRDIKMPADVAEIDLGNEAKGIYFYRLLQNGKMICSGKFLLR